jgi:integrase/recombinase XerD
MKKYARGAYDSEGRRKYLSKSEGQRFLRHAATLPRRDALFCLAIYYSGCRISEALALRRQDIDVETKALLIRSLKKRGKTEVRRVPLPGFLVNQLSKTRVQNGDLLWPFSRWRGWRVIKAVMKTANISGIQATTKGLRHSFGVRGALGQIPVSLIQTWMGHSDASTTAIYLAVRDEEERQLIEKTW